MADDRGPALAAVLIALLVLCVVSTLLRFYSMAVILRRFYVEDWLAMFTLVLYCTYTAVALLGVSAGVGKHVHDVSPPDRVRAVMWRWIASLFYIAISSLVKLVIGLFLLRIIAAHCRWQRVVLWVLMGVVTVFNVFYLFIAIFACRPVEYQWTRYDVEGVHEGECNSTLFATVPTYVSAFLNVLADWVLPVLPAMLVRKTQMEARRKLSVCAVISLGSIASIASIVRLPYAYGILDNPDYLYTYQPIAVWSTIEIGVGFTASSLATLTPLFRKIKVFRGSTGATHQADAGVGAEGADSRFRARRTHERVLSADKRAQKGGSDDGAGLERQDSDEVELYPVGGRRDRGMLG